MFFDFNQILIECSANKQWRPRSEQNVVSDLGLHCLHMSHKKDARLIGVKRIRGLEKLNHYL